MYNQHQCCVEKGIKQKYFTVYSIHILVVIITGLQISCTPRQQEIGLDKPFEPPSFSGEFKVGTTSYHWIDEDREESFTPEADDNRELFVRLYYPTDIKNEDNQLELLPSGFEEFYLEYSPVENKALRLSNFANKSWPISINVPVSDKINEYPLIVFSHGYYLLPELHTFLASELASRGFIVASINHTYGSANTELSDGSTVHAVDHPEGDLGTYHYIWAKDQLFVARKVRNLSMQPDNLLSKKIANHTAIVGHSYGGSSGFHAATMSHDFDAIVDVDGRIFDLEGKSISTPFMYIHSEELSQEEAFSHVNASGYAVIFKGLTHNSFTDLPIFWDWDFPQEHIFGDMKQNNPQVVVAEYIVNFLNSEFSQQKPHLLKTSKIEDLEIEIIEYPCK